ncbi:hypothetical protein Tco_0495831 [Tanacetum coccineum]
MSAITDVKCVLSQKAFDAFCEKFHILEEVHPVLPNQGDTMHERLAGKIRLYTRFFDFANFRLPLSSFLIDVLRHFHINISQLFVYGIAKVSHFENFFHVYGIIPTVGLFRCFYVNSKKNGWMSFNSFACPALFLWHTAKNVTRDPALVGADFNAQDYATFVAHPFLFQKFPKEFLCLVGLSRHYTLDEETYLQFLHKKGEVGFLLLYTCYMDLFAFIHTLDLTKLKVVERERVENEPLLLQTTVSHIVPLLPVAPDRAESELETSIDKLFDEGGSGNQAGQGDSAGVREGANIQPVTEAIDTVAKDVAPLQPRLQRKRKIVVVDAGEASHPPKKLQEDHRTPSGASVGGKSRFAVQQLLVGAVLNAEVRGEPILTLPFVTSSISAMSGHSSHHSGTNVAEAEVDSLIRSFAPVMTTVTIVTPTVDTAVAAKEKPVESSLFGASSSSAGRTDPTPGGFSDLTGSDFIIGGIRTVISPDTDLQKFFTSICGMQHDQLFTEFNVGVDRQMSLRAEVKMRAKYNIREKRRLKSVAEERAELLKVREKEVEDLKAQLLLKEAETAEVIRLRVEASKLEAVEKSIQDEVKALKECNASLEQERGALDVRVTGLKASAMGKDSELTDLNAQLTSIKSHNDNLVDQVHELEVSSSGLQEKLSSYENMTEQLEEFQDDQLEIVNDKFDKLWLLTHGMKLAIIKCLNSLEYLSALGATIGNAIEKGMQDGLAAGITHGKEGRELTDVAAHNCHTPKRVLDGIRVRRRDVPGYLKYKA